MGPVDGSLEKLFANTWNKNDMGQPRRTETEKTQAYVPRVRVSDEEENRRL